MEALIASSDNWDTIISQLETLILAVTASNNPNYSIAGRSYSKGDYLGQLMTAYEQAKARRQEADGAWQIDSRGVT